MIQIILIALAAIVIVFLGIVAMQPSAFRVDRSAIMMAPASAIFPQVNNFRHWEVWSPWEKPDPQLKRTYSGAPAGTGAVYAWAGNKHVGEGQMTIIDSHPHERIRIQIEFFKPFKGTHTIEFTFKPEENHTVVTWSMFGKNTFMGKTIGLFMNMNQMIGGKFEEGLAELKALVEATPENRITASSLSEV